MELQEEEEFDELRIYLVPRVTRRPFDRVKIYGKYGHEGEPTSKSYDFESINLWDDGAGVFLKNTVIPSEEFTILIVGQAETTYELKM